MSSFLYRLGHAVSRRAGRAVAVWLVLLVGVGALAGGLGGTLQDDLTIPGTESQVAACGLRTRQVESLAQ